MWPLFSASCATHPSTTLLAICSFTFACYTLSVNTRPSWASALASCLLPVCSVSSLNSKCSLHSPTGSFPQLYPFYLSYLSFSVTGHQYPTSTSYPLTEQYILTNPSLPWSKPASMNGMMSEERSSYLMDAFTPQCFQCKKSTTYK